jgi:hypothetical protein
VLTSAFVTTRNLADFVPFLVLGGIAGAYVVWARIRAARSRAWRVVWWAVAGVAALLVLFGVGVNVALAHAA